MDKQDQKKALMEHLHKSLSVFGYRKNTSKQHFWKPFEFGKVAIHLSFINHNDDFDITVDVGIRFDELEEMKNLHNTLLSAKEKKQTFSIGAELGNVSEGKPKRWTINSESDIELIANNIYRTIEKVAFPYIEKFSNLENAFEGCLNDGKESWLITAIDSKRAMNTVGLAKILNKTDQINKIIQYKSKFLEEQNDFGFTLFKKFSNFVRDTY
ncbi:DUF4304 domain-containing protein [Neobacillus notoginsengisoli]|uniref:DUF4304 domain-containing protein n=1 Tax=Neobacillus notoginsengisoli TaxID=1578198 RepID=A0A417YZY4_9BACI|nr:DUF4304 domain-containing protein [Neobacillus notoginsengisoli]RHW43432.1 DUF4304 domain-containing protein [Neobacillus notoginsengisoli]